MIISALVVTWRGSAGSDQLPDDPRLTWGPRHAARQALVTEATDTQAAEDLFRWLQDQPAVAAVDLVSARYDDDDEPADAFGAEEDRCAHSPAP